MWEVDAQGVVRVEDDEEDNTCPAALDAALRATWDLGGTVDASRAGCVAVVDAYGYVAPLALALFVRTGAFGQQLKLFVGRGANVMGAVTATVF